MITTEPKKRRLNLKWLAAAVLAGVFVASAFAQDEPIVEEPLPDEELELLPEGPQILGTIEDTGTYFEVTDSEYLNLVFQSSEPVHLTLESVPQMVVMHVEAAEGASATWITLTGFAPSTTYYKYEDDYHNEVAFTTDDSGSYTYAQDLAIPHLVFIQPQAGTRFIPSDPDIGTWDSVNRIYTLTTNVKENIQIDEDNLTLDGDGHKVYWGNSGVGYGVYLPGRTGVTIQNLNVEQFYAGWGIYLNMSGNNTLTGNTVWGNERGICLANGSSDNILTDNTVSSNSRGIILSSSGGNTLTDNQMSGSKHNFRVSGAADFDYQNNVDTSNTVDGKPVYYVVNGVGGTYDSSTNAGVFYAINCDGITIKDLLLTKNLTGVFLWNTNNSTIENVLAQNNYYGIFLSGYSSGNTLTVNNVLNNYYGILLGGYCSNNTLAGNTAWNNTAGITLSGSSDNTVTGNIANLNTPYGIYLTGSGNNILTGNIANSNNHYGIYMLGGSNNTLTGNTCNSNNRNGIHLGATGNVLTGNTANSNDGHGISLWYQGGNTLTDNTANWNNSCGIYIRRGSSYNTLTGNTASNNSHGILLIENTNRNTLTGNTVNSNSYSGIYLNWCRFNSLTGNTASNNGQGIYLYYGAHHNTLTGNTVNSNTGYGIYLYSSSYNRIYNNNFIDNLPQAGVDGGTGNVFNLPAPTGGNYWSDWTSPDGDNDGFVDEPYVFTGGQDNLPWTVQDGWNLPPVADAAVDLTVEAESPEGTEVTLDGSGSTDPDSTPGTNDDIISFDWYEGDTFLGNGEIINHTFALGTHLVTLLVTDSHGETDDDEVVIIVQDTIPPEIFIDAPEPYGLYQVGGLALEFSATDAVGVSQLWGILTDTVGDPQEVYPGDVVVQAGVYTLVVSAIDGAGNSADSEPVFFVVYDPEGGFVTGGGWLESPEGAYKPDTSLTGKANFGFVSKYKKGATVPTGNTEFVFHAGGLNFHSSSYQWLVVTGSDYARFKGTGTINGSGQYKFMLWAGDHNPDTFRIKIWEEDESDLEFVIYDNGMDQAISGGSIVVHTK